MNIVIIVRLLLIILLIVVVDLVIKLNKFLSVERRISRYSVDSLMDNQGSIGDKLKIRYERFILKNRKKLKDNKAVLSQASKYKKYITIGDNINIIDFIIIKLVVGIIFVLLVVISFVINGHLVSFLGMIISFIFGYYIFDIYIYFDTKHKKKRIKNDMLRAVILLNNAFKAGKSIIQAVYIASQELPAPICYEFTKIYQDLSFGISSDVAFSRFANRVNLEEARYISSSLTILNKTGGNIVAVFSSIERTLFDKKKLEEDLKNSTQASNMVVKFLILIPVAFVIIIYLLSPTYFDPLFHSTLGYVIIFMACISFIIFVWLLNKVMKVKV